MFDGLFHGPLSKAYSMGTDMQPRMVEKDHELMKPISLLAHQIFPWNTDVVESQLRRFGGPDSEFIL